MTYTYNNKGTCSVRTVVELNDDHTIKSVQVLGGCDGNLKGIAKLLPGMKAEDAIARMEATGRALHEGRGRHRPHGGHDLWPQAHQLPRPDRPGTQGRTGGDGLIKVSRGGFYIRPGRLRQPHTLRAHIECAPTFCPQGLLL